MKTIQLKTLSALLLLLISVLGTTNLNAATYSYTNFVTLPTLMATPQWCPNDPVITYAMNQPTYYALPTGLTACGYPPNSYYSNYYAAIDGQSFRDKAASGGDG